ncbi:hypothetical protein CVT26_012015 [Gymnopilus dilepis]|uniref:Uncharacterized protein n=1 Tax=Gymnopilus dilepis TaxID=231916 RepID=A0A409YHS8_9AGAR|nr:hypothetical protein CVT26_012015 [Gymnopilus dilepis]
MKKAFIPVEDADDEVVVERMEKPPGEAGTSDGFNLQESMGLKDDKDLYNNIMREVRTQVHLNPKLDPFITFNYQDAGSLANVYRKVTAMYPYLTSDRFPRSWPIAEMTKQYLANWRRRVRAAARRAKAAKAALSSKTASSSKRRLEDDEE